MRKRWLVVALLLVACDGADPAAPSPTPLRPPASTSTGQAERPTLDDLPLGDPPTIGYVEDHVYVAADGPRSALPGRSGISGIAAWRDGFLVSDTVYFEGTLGLTRLDGAGRVVQEWPSGGEPAAGRDGQVAWTSVTVSEASRPGLTRIFVGDADGRVRAQTVRPGIIGVHGFSRGAVVFSRWWREGVYLTDLRSPPRRLTWWPHQLRPAAVSPDGSRMLGHRGRWLQVRDLRTGRLLRRLELRLRWVQQVAWEDTRHLLAVVSTEHRTAIVRLGLDGSVELAMPIRRVPDALDRPYVLGTPA